MNRHGGRIRILAVAPYADMRRLLEEAKASREDEIEMTICVGDWEEGVRLAREMMTHQEFDVILSRGGTAKLLRERLLLPVIAIPFSISDMLRDIKMFDHYVGKFAVVGVGDVTKNARIICDILQKDVQICTVEQMDETEMVIEQLKTEGVSLVICDRVRYQAAQRLGVNAIFSTASIESIQAGIDEAVRFVHANTAIYRQNELLKEALIHDDEAVILYAPDHNVVVSSISKEKNGDLLLEALEVPKKKSGDRQEFLKKFRGKLYSIRTRTIDHDNEAYTLLRISGRPNAFSSKKCITVYQASDDEENGIADCNSANMTGDTLELIQKYARSPVSVLILGEVGTGKDKTARLLYRLSDYSTKPLFIIDCSIAGYDEWERLLLGDDSPLAVVDNAIHFKDLDMLGEKELQLFFQYALTTGFMRRNHVTISMTLGSGREAEIRMTLLNIHHCVAFHLPALRERMNELPNILALYTNKMNVSLGKQVVGFSREALLRMQSYAWPGNLDQLNWVMRELILLADSAYIGVEMVDAVLAKEEKIEGADMTSKGRPFLHMNCTLEDMTYEIVCAVLAEERGNKERTAARLGIGRTTLWRILKNRVK